MNRAGTLALISMVAAASAHGAERTPVIRVHVRAAEGAVDVDDSVSDLRQALQQGKVAPNLTDASMREASDVQVFVTNRFALPKPRRSDHEEPPLDYVIRGLLIDGKSHEGVSGHGVVWRQAAIDLARTVDAYVRAHQHTLLRRRVDWADPGFDFEPLTKEHAKQARAKPGAPVVTAVRPEGPAATAGLQVGDAILKLGSRKVEAAGDVARAVYTASPGDVLQLEVTQKGARRTVSVVLP